MQARNKPPSAADGKRTTGDIALVRPGDRLAGLPLLGVHWRKYLPEVALPVAQAALPMEECPMRFYGIPCYFENISEKWLQSLFALVDWVSQLVRPNQLVQLPVLQKGVTAL